MSLKKRALCEDLRLTVFLTAARWHETMEKDGVYGVEIGTHTVRTNCVVLLIRIVMKDLVKI